MSIIRQLFGSRRRSTTEVMIALHCSGSSGRQWDAYDKLLPRGMRLVTPELMGYRPGECWSCGTVSLEAEARRLGPLLFSHTDGVHLVGHSYGGAVALQMALRWPDRIKTLTLFEPVRFSLLLEDHDEGAAWEAITTVGRRIGSHVLSGRLEEAAALFVDYWSGSGAWDRLPASRRRGIVERMPKVRSEFEALFADTVPAWWFRKLEMPVRLITGSTSPLPARRVSDIIVRHCPRAELVRLEGVSHMGPITHAALVASHLAFQPRETTEPQLALAA
jgi:pimeloyl-ACP methyl ester carboxylesterase